MTEEEGKTNSVFGEVDEDFKANLKARVQEEIDDLSRTEDYEGDDVISMTQKLNAASFLALIGQVGRKRTSKMPDHLVRRFRGVLGNMRHPWLITSDADAVSRGTFTFLSSSKGSETTLQESAGVFLDLASSSEVGRAVSHAVLRSFTTRAGLDDAVTELVSYRAFSGLLPQSVAMAFLVEAHPEICLAPELSSEVHSLLEQLKYMSQNIALLKYARFARIRMPIEIQGRRSFATLLELGLIAAKAQSRLLDYQASTNLSQAQHASFSKFKVYILSKGSLPSQVSLRKSNESLPTKLGIADEEEVEALRGLLLRMQKKAWTVKPHIVVKQNRTKDRSKHFFRPRRVLTGQ